MSFWTQPSLGCGHTYVQNLHSLPFYASGGGKSTSASWLNMEFKFWWTLTCGVETSTNSDGACVVDPSNGIQTIKPSSVCLTSCTAPIQHHQTIYSCVTATSVDCLSLESPEMFEHSKISEKIQAKGRVSPRGHHCHTTSRVRGEFCESKHCFISKICIVYPQSAGYLMLTVQFHDNWATRRLMIASHF